MIQVFIVSLLYTQNTWM